MKKILQIDGGGIRGIIPAGILAHLEEQCRKPLGQCFDLITGTSTGAIIGGAIAAGVPAKEIQELYLQKGKKLFSKRSLFSPTNWLNFIQSGYSKYDRRPFVEEMEKIQVKKSDNQSISLGQVTLAELSSRFMATAFNLSSQRTHFIKSWEAKDQSYRLVDTIAWSALSGAYYFGKIDVAGFKWQNFTLKNFDSPANQKKGAVFQDGGQGGHHNTLGYILTEVLANRWDQQEEVYILSLGTGEPEEYIPYEVAEKFGIVDQIKSYLDCQARKESISNQVFATYYVARERARGTPHVFFKRIDKTIDETEVGLDRIEYIEKYQQYSEELKEEIQAEDIEILRN